MNQLQASLMKSVATTISTSVTGIQSQIETQACSGLSRPLLQIRTNIYSTINDARNDIIHNLSTRMNDNASTARSLEPDPPPRLAQR